LERPKELFVVSSNRNIASKTDEPTDRTNLCAGTR